VLGVLVVLRMPVLVVAWGCRPVVHDGYLVWLSELDGFVGNLAGCFAPWDPALGDDTRSCHSYILRRSCLFCLFFLLISCTYSQPDSRRDGILLRMRGGVWLFRFRVSMRPGTVVEPSSMIHPRP
jgi:hypothetical protein